MPARKRTLGIEAADSDQEHLAAPHQGVPLEELSDDVISALDELGAKASAVIVERMKDGKPGEFDYVTRMSAGEFKTEYIKEQFGGGDYKITVIDAVRGRLNPVMLSIDKRFVGRLFANTPTPVSSGGVANDPFRDRLLEVLLAKALTPAAPVNSSRETIDLVLAIVGALKGGDSGSTMEQIKTMFDMSRELAAMANPPEGLAAVASNYLPVVERLVAANRQPHAARVTHTTTAPRALPAAAPVVAPTPAPAPMSPAPTPATVAGRIIPKWLIPFQSFSGHLVKIADRGSDPTMYADMAIDEVQDNDDAFAAAVDAMHGERLLSDLLAVCPELDATDQRKEFARAFVAAFTSGLTEILSSADSEESEAQA